jgi:hypothetical protein
VVAADMSDADGHPAELDVEPILEDDVGRNNLDDSRRGQFFLDVRNVLRGGMAGGGALVEPFVAPIHRRQLDQPLSSQCMGDHLPAQLCPAEDVIPVGMRIDHSARARCCLCPQCVQERPCVSLRRSSVQHERASIADDPAHRRTVRRARWHPVDVLGDLGQYAHRPILENVPRAVTFGGNGI